MRSIGKAVRTLAATALVVAGSVATSQASTISVSPSSQTINVGGTAAVDILLSGLAANETVGAFAVLVTFNNAVIGSPDSYTVDPDAKMGAYDPFNDFSVPLSGSINFGGSTVDMYYLANLVTFPTDPLLKASEGSGFRLATLIFTGLTEGLANITLSLSPQAANGAFLSNFDGTVAIPATVVNGQICVDDPQTPVDRCAVGAEVPEPATLSLLGTGIAALVARRRRKTRS